MSLKYNNVIPTEIKYNGTDLTVVKYGNVAVWSKQYSLKITTSGNLTVTVTRTDSPNQHAGTGLLSNGNSIYYGDVLKISAIANNGSTMDTFTVNGITWTNNQTITVNSSINVNAVAIISASWHTVWNGSFIVTSAQGNGHLEGILRQNVPTRATFSGCIVTGSNVYHNMHENVDLTFSTMYESPDGGGYMEYLVDGGGSSENLGVIIISAGGSDLMESFVEVTQVQQYY